MSNQNAWSVWRLIQLILLIFAVGLMASARRAWAAAPRAPTLKVVQTGSGSTAGHAVVLTWTASADAAAVPGLTYTMERASGLCGTSGQTFAPLTTGTGIAGTTFTDDGVSPAAQFSYEVVAVAPNGVESPPSNCSQAVIPLAGATNLANKAS